MKGGGTVCLSGEFSCLTKPATKRFMTITSITNSSLLKNEHLNILKVEKWWRDIYNDPCITDAAKKEIFGGKKPDESIRLFKEPAEICGEEDVWVLTRDYISSTGAEMRERIMAKELSVKE